MEKREVGEATGVMDIGGKEMRLLGMLTNLRRRETPVVEGVNPRREATIIKRKDCPVRGDMAASMIPWAFRPDRYTGMRMTAPSTARPPLSIPMRKAWMTRS